MKKIHIANVDLNLLVVFDALVAEGHATRAAERIGLTQPAVAIRSIAFGLCSETRCLFDPRAA